eukprot:6492731-Amphidinium_carterae.1
MGDATYGVADSTEGRHTSAMSRTLQAEVHANLLLGDADVEQVDASIQEVATGLELAIPEDMLAVSHAQNVQVLLGVLNVVPMSKGLHIPLEVMSQRRRHANGFGALSLLSEALVLAMNQACKEVDAIDGDYEKLAEKFLKRYDMFHLASVAQRAVELDINERVLQEKLWRLMSAHWEFAKLKRYALEKHMASLSEDSLLVYIDYAAYDETPMKGSLKGDGCASALSVNSGHLPSSSQCDLHTVKHLEAAQRSSAMTLKFLQTQQRVAMLVKGRDKVFKLCANFPSPLQVCQRTTGEVLHECLLMNSGCTQFSNKFQVKVRASCSDQAGENHRAEDAVVRNRQDWLDWHSNCDVHKTASVCKRSYAILLAKELEGLLHSSLSLRTAGSLLLFKRCLKQVVSHKLVILSGSPSLAAQEYKKRCLDLFFGDSTTKLWQQMILLALPNGDWQNLDHVEYYKESGDTRSNDEIAQVLETGLACALLLHKPPVYVRSRWTGLDLCVDALMRIECIHGLMTESYKLFMKMHEQPQSLPLAGSTTRAETWSGAMNNEVLEDAEHGEHVVACERQTH